MRGQREWFNSVRDGSFRPGIMPATYINSGLYHISSGKLRHAMAMIPQLRAGPWTDIVSGLKKSVFKLKRRQTSP